MNIILTEDQYQRIGRYNSCPTQVTFSVFTPIVSRWKQRTRCVSDEFYTLLQEYQEDKFDKSRSINSTLKKLIDEYFYKTYYITPEEFEINYITGNVVNIKLNPIKN